MKKLFISLLTVAATLNVMATSSVTIRIEDNDGWAKNMILAESTEGTIAMEVNDASSVALYAMHNSKKCEQLRLEELGERAIGFKIQATTATMTVTEASGDALYMKTLADGTITELAKDAVINITIASDKVNTWVEDMFQLYVAPAYTRDVTGGQLGTICYPKAITGVQGGTLYSLTWADLEGGKVYGIEASLPTTAGQPYVFQANADATQLVMPYTGDEASVQPATGLVGTLEDTTVPAGAYGILNDYIVEIVAGNPLLAYRAYIDMENLPKEAPVMGAPGRPLFKLANTATGMQEIKAMEGTRKAIVNGRLVIIREGRMFNALGGMK